MKKVVVLSVLITLVSVAAVLGVARYVMQAPWKPRPEGTPTPAPSGAGWENLLEEKNIPLWKNITDDSEIFEIKDGELHILGRSMTTLRYAGYTGRAFGNFDLHLEFRLARRTNSGVFLRVRENDPVRRGFEVQVLDDHRRPPSMTGTGSLYDVACPMFNMARPAGEWNSYDISVQERRVVVHVNGWKVLDTDLARMTMPIGKFPIAFAELPLEGMIALQDHGGEAWFRNIWIRPL
ncbi:MAG: hypothetical protein BWY09_00339 [Candidatus Hydrogenedentes bacterium ADurb.Bin179]|nr:MAG: hypothetical protein BWY09_00339 [Candidatus Hydrogenedentes bacterium ADurb.Bin179]